MTPAAKSKTSRRRRIPLRHKVIRWGLMSLCGFFSLYVFAASFETTFSYDLPVVSAVSTVTTPPLSRLIQAGRQTKQTDFGNYGDPGVLKIPSHDSRIVLAPAISRAGKLLARANTAHFTLLSSPKNGNLGDVMVYFVATWRTDAKADEISTGDNIFIDTTRDWRYFYRVDAVRNLNDSETYVARESATPQMILVAQTSAKHLMVIESSFVNVQNVRQ